MQVTPDLRPVRADEVLHFPSGDTICLHHLDLGTYYILNEVGRLIWEMADGVLSLEQIADRLCAEFEIDKETALADCLTFVQELQEAECITFAEG